MYVQLQYALHEVSALRARLNPATDAPVSDNLAVPATIYEVVTSEPACGGEESIEDSAPSAVELPTIEAIPVAKLLSRCRQKDGATNTHRVAKTAPTKRRAPSVPRGVDRRNDLIGGACAPGGDGDDPPVHSHTIVDDGRDGEPEEDDAAEDGMYGPPPEPSPSVRDVFANPPRLSSGRELHPFTRSGRDP